MSPYCKDAWFLVSSFSSPSACSEDDGGGKAGLGTFPEDHSSPATASRESWHWKKQTEWIIIIIINNVSIYNVPCIRVILTTNLAECVCVCAKCDAFLPVRSHFFFKLPEFFFRIAKFPCAAFGPLFACHCPIFFTKNNTLNGVYAECNSGPLK